jgi:phage-related protein
MNRQKAGYFFLAAFLSIVGLTARTTPLHAANKVTLHELQVFDNFLDAHPAIDKDLQKNPTLATDKKYLAAHPDLKNFLEAHPGVRSEVKDRPRFFIRREEQFDRSNRDITLGEVRSFDNFLDDHSAIDRELTKNPSLINDREYIAKHPELREYLGAHPAVRADLHENPRAFMSRERKFDKQEKKVADAKPAPKPRPAAEPKTRPAPIRPNR